MDVARRRSSGVAGVMLGRAAMSAPWVFREIKQHMATGVVPGSASLAEHWAHIGRHCRMAVERSGSEVHTMHAMRSRLMAYSRGMPEAKALRARFSQVGSLAELGQIAEESLEAHGRNGGEGIAGDCGCAGGAKEAMVG